MTCTNCGMPDNLHDVPCRPAQAIQQETLSLANRLVEMEAENKRLREGLTFIQENSAIRGPKRMAEKLLSQPTNTTGLLDLAVAAVKAIAESYEWNDDSTVADLMAPIEEIYETLSPETKQLLDSLEGK